MEQLIATALQNQLALWVEGDELALSFISTDETSEPCHAVLGSLKAAKPELLDFLRAEQVFSEQHFMARFANNKPGASQAAVEAVFAANSLQQGFVFHHLSQPDDDAYLVQLLLDHDRPLVLACYVQAWQWVAQCYPALRLSFDWDGDGEVLQIVSRQHRLDASKFRLLDLSALSASAQDAVIEQERLADRQQPFDLRETSLLRFVVFQLGSRGTTVLKTEHHAITDGWSGTILLQKVYQCYTALLAGEPVPLLPADSAYLAAQQYYQQGRLASQQFWQQQQARFHQPNDLGSMLDLAPAAALSDSRRVLHNAEISHVLPPALASALRAQCRALGVTLNAAVQCGWHKLVQLYSGDSQTIVGTTVSGRDLPIDGVAESVGLYINTLPLALDWPEDVSLAVQLQQLQLQSAQLNSHSDVALSALQQAAGRGVGQRLFHSLLIYENYPAANDAMAAAGIRLRQSAEKMDYPLVLMAFERQHDTDTDTNTDAVHLSLLLKYDGSLCREPQARRLLDQLQLVLQAIATTPAQLHHQVALCTQAELALLAQFGQGPAVVQAGVAAQTLAQRFARQALASPTALALRAVDGELSYQQLAAQVWQLACQLQKHGVGPGRIVAVCLARHSQLVVSLLAVQQLGAAYLPLDPSYPPARLADMLSDAGPLLVLSEAAAFATVQSACALANLALPLLDIRQLAVAAAAGAAPADATGLLAQHAGADNAALAYLIYTSGSTGKPKGVQVAQAQVSTFISAMQQLFGFDSAAVPQAEARPLATAQPIACGQLLAVTSVCFDIHVLELFLPLLSGGTVVLASSEQARDPALLLPLLSEQVSMMQATPATWKMLLAVDWRPQTPLWLLSGGEALSLSLARQLLALPLVRLWNMYGPTETTVWSCAGEVSTADISTSQAITVGQPIAGTQVLVLSQSGQLLPPGVAGELWIGGAGVSLGYRQRAAETAARFAPLPGAAQIFPVAPADDSGIYYRTGDLVRWQVDLQGNARLLVLGRLDQQVKVRGYRIELAEIEQHLLAMAHIADAVVVLQHQTGMSQGGAAPAEPQLVAYVVWHDATAAADAAEQDVLAQLASRLPAYMVPTALVSLPALPLTLNGKVDRKALPPAQFQQRVPVAPVSPLQQQLVLIWQRLLQLETVGITDNFFALGGHSVLAIQLVAAIRQQTGLPISLNQLLATPTIAGLAALAGDPLPAETLIGETRVGNAAADADSGPHSIGLGAAATILPAGSLAASDLAAGDLVEDTATAAPLSFAQERMLFIEQYDSGSASYQLPLVARLTEDAEPAILQQALALLTERHSQLRTQYHRDQQGQFYPALQNEVPELLLPASAFTQQVNSEAQLRHAIQQEILTPFDLTRQAPLRLRYFQLGQSRYLLLLWHHIAVDGWSVHLLLNELAALYQSLLSQRGADAVSSIGTGTSDSAVWYQRAGLAPLALDYGDFARWQRALDLKTQRDYWLTTLAGHQQLQLPLSNSRPLQASLAGRNQLFVLDAALTTQLKQRAKALNTSLYTVLLSGFALALSQLCAQTDLLIGTVSDGRHLPETQPLVGMFANTLVLRLQLEHAADIASLVQQAHQQVLQARAQQDLPFEQLLDLLQLPRDPSRHPLFQVMFSYDSTDLQRELPTGLPLRPLWADRVNAAAVQHEQALYSPAKFDLDLAFSPDQQTGGLTGTLNYAVSLFSEAQACRIAGYVVRALQAVAAGAQRQLSEISLLSDAELAMLNRWQQGPALSSVEPAAPAQPLSPPAGTLLGLFSQVAAANPDASALVWYQRGQRQHWTYQQLATEVARLRSWLLRLYQWENAAQQPVDRLQADSLVAICLPRGPAQICAQLAVQAAGAACLPLSLDQPPERLAFVLADSTPLMLLTADTEPDDVAPQPATSPALATTTLAAIALPQLALRVRASGLAARVVSQTRAKDGGALPASDLLCNAADLALDPSALQPGDLAYVIYTSGTTGTPKGVLTEHQAIVARLRGWQQLYLPGTAWVPPQPAASQQGLRLLSMAEPAFDVALADWVRALCTGGCLVLCDKDTALEPAALSQLCQLEQISFADFVPVLLRQLLDHLAGQAAVRSAEPPIDSYPLPALRQLVVGGDTWTQADERKALQILGPAVTIYNSYGLTECAVDSTVACSSALTAGYDVAPAQGCSMIGRPLPGVSVYVLDGALRQVPPGAIGELYIGGAGLARGYLRRDDLTNSRFLLNPYATPQERATGWQRMYKTGDLVRWRADGQLEYLGRNDFQVKIRGHRIELTDIEQALLQLPTVVQAAVIDYPASASAGDDHAPDSQHKLLVAYLVLSEGQALDVGWVSHRLAQLLPAYMLPASYNQLHSLPLSSNGKLDRARLPAPQFATETPYQAATTPLARQLAAIWRQVLGPVFPHELPGLADNFFQYGGDSVRALQLVNLAQQQGLALSTRLLFECQTLGALASALQELAPAQPAGSDLTQSALHQPKTPALSLAELQQAELPALPKPADRRLGADFQPLVQLNGRGKARLYLIPPSGAGAECYLRLARLLHPGWSLHLCENIERALGGHYAMPDLAAYYSQLIASDQPPGPVVLFGASHGALLAHDVALRLPALGVQVAGLVLLDPIGYTLSAQTEQQLLAEPALLDLPASEQLHFIALLHQLRYSRALPAYPADTLVFQSSGLTADISQWQLSDHLLFSHYNFFTDARPAPQLSYGLDAYLPAATAVALHGDHGQLFSASNLTLISTQLDQYLQRAFGRLPAAGPLPDHSPVTIEGSH